MKQIEIARFFRQLATLISAHIPITQSLSILLQSQKNRSLQRVIHTLKTEIEAGSGLAKGLQQFPLWFDHLICQLTHTGEMTGTLDQILNQIALLLEKSVDIKHQIKQSLFYPLTVLCIALLVCLLMMLFIIPRFADFFNTLHAPLPYFTYLISQVSDGIRQHCFMLLIFALACGLIMRQLNRSIHGRQILFDTLLKLPPVRYLSTQFFILHFARNLAIIYGAGINIADGLKMMSMIFQQSDYKIAVQQLQYKVSSGQQLHIAMRGCKLYPLLMLQMIRIGEESGTLQKMLESIAQNYQNEVNRLVNKLNQLLEPLIMIILGVLIGGVVIAMYLPIFKLGMAL